MSLPGRAVSPWRDGEEGRTPSPPLGEDLAVDVAVVGAGIVGLTTALEAQRDGASVAVLEGRDIGAGVTGNTTAKLSALHGLSYDPIASTHGLAAARVYAEANQWGVEHVAANAQELGLDCDLRRKPNHTYTEDPSQLDSIQAEVDAAGKAGLDVSFTTSTDLPFEITGAVRCEDQAEFHPLKYLRGVAQALEQGGARVFERTRVTGVPAEGVRTESGRTVRADRVVLATQMPFADRSLLFARCEVKRSYAITVRTAGPPPQGMYLQAESPGRTVRAIPWPGGDLLMVGGESHDLGHGDPVEKFEALERYARERFQVSSIEHRWDAHDFMPDDGLPYLGRLLPGSDRVLTATGLRKWGLAMGTAAGRILADQIAGHENSWAPTFDPWRRPSLRSVAPLIKHNADSGLQFFTGRLVLDDDPESLKPGEGSVFRDGLRLKAVHRDEAGELHAVSARCTHLGCIVRWNAPERTWDCPCHGSRFEATGEVANGPATAPLRRAD